VENAAQSETSDDMGTIVVQETPHSVLAVLGSGGQGKVTLEERNGQRVAVKRVRQRFNGCLGTFRELLYNS